jgi:uncharacterized Ntn-hydrolase superfamily protein
MTFSIAARSADGEWFGVAVASRCLAVGRAVPAAEVGVGAVATQARCNLTYKRRGLEALRAGRSASETVELLTTGDPVRDERQVGVVDRGGQAMSHTGSACVPWAGDRHGAGYAIQGNILAGEHVVDAMERAWLATSEAEPMGRRLVATLLAGDRAGGDRRGRQSAALLVVTAEGAYEGGSDEHADLRVDDHPDPVVELSRLHDIRDLHFDLPDPTTTVALDDALVRELDTLLDRVGYRPSGRSADDVAGALERWAFDEFLSRRLLPDAVDVALLGELRRRAVASWAHPTLVSR